MSLQDRYGGLSKIGSFLHKHYLSHPALASIPVIAFEIALNKPFMGATAGVFAYLAREIFHTQTGHGPKNWYAGLLPQNWSKDNWWDLWPVLVWCPVLAYGLYLVTGWLPI